MSCDATSMRQLRGRTLRYFKVFCFILFIAFLIWYTVSALKKKVTPLYASGVVERQVGDLHYDFSTGIFVYNNAKGVYLQGIVSETLRSTFTVPCKSDNTKPPSTCLHWLRYAKLEVSKVDTCHHVKWTPTSRDFIPHDCFSLRNAHWYGGSELYDQTWPLETVDVPMQPYLSNDILFRSKSQKDEGKNMFGNVVERFWINSNGVGIIVNSAVPLFVSVNESKSNLLCFSADYSNSHYNNPDGKIPVLEYTVCKENSISKIHKLLRRKYFHLPLGLPNQDLMKGIIWSTWGRFKPNLTQALLLSHAKNVSDMVSPLGLVANYIEIDDKYATTFGDFNFDESVFRNSHQMISYLKEYKFDVIVSMTPFVSVDSKSFKSKPNYLISDVQEQTPSLIRWYSGFMGVIDITNPDTSKWYMDKLSTMAKEYGIKSFNFHGCETNFLPKIHKTFKPLANPGTFTTEFVSQINEHSESLVQVSCGYQTQKYPVYTKSARKESHWLHKNGLRSVIPSILTLGILGYQFSVPDIIGGTVYGANGTLALVKPEPELYIRWMQLAMFMPAALCRTFAGLTRRTIFSYQVRAFADQGPDKLEPTEEKRDLGTEGFHSIHPPKDSFEGKVETSETEMPSMLGHMLGEERDEILKELQGVKDQFEFEGREITSREGTRQDPILVRSEANERIVGCICDEGEVHFNYMVLNRGPARRCMCGFWFKLVQV